MRLGLFLMGSADAGYPEMLDQAEKAEQLGVDALVLGERHFRHAGLLYPSTLTIGAAVAARTERMRIGLAGRVLSLDHPVRVAEDAATLDVLSGGRLDFGVTRASLDEEAHLAFNSPLAESEGRFEEAFEVIRRAWIEQEISFEGEYFRVPDLTVYPRPVQQPHPPLYCVAISPGRLAFAAREGISVYLGAIRPVPEVAETAHSYWDQLAEAGHDRDGTRVAVNRFVYVGRDDASAREEIERPFMEFMHNHAPDLKAALIARYGGEDALGFDRLAEDFFVYGGPETVADRLREVRDGVESDYMLITLNFVTLPHKLTMRSMELLCREVAPALREGVASPA